MAIDPGTQPSIEPTYPFRMHGRIVQTFRYSVKYTISAENEAGIERIEMTDYTPSYDEAMYLSEKYGGKVFMLSAVSYGWIEGVEVPDVPDTMKAAMEIYDMGKDAYLAKKNIDETATPHQLRADLDFAMLMGGLT